MKCTALSMVAGAIMAAVAAGMARQPGSASTPARLPKPSIVLVHGAFADGSSWRQVIPLLQDDGYEVIAVQNQVASLTEDIATTKRVIQAQKGPVVVVGHSYGGAVITGAAADAANVKALVFLAAWAPDGGESMGTLAGKFKPTPLVAALAPDAAGFLYVDPAKFRDAFCKDVPDAEARIMAVTQKPMAGAIFDQTTPTAAWKSVPAWYLVATDDQAINPDLQRFMAKRMGAKVTELATSHVPFISRPRDVVKMIEEAAGAAK